MHGRVQMDKDAHKILIELVVQPRGIHRAHCIPNHLVTLERIVRKPVCIGPHKEHPLKQG